MDEDKYQKAINDGSIAQDLVDNPGLKQALSELKDVYLEALLNAQTVEGREAAWFLVRAHQQFIVHLYSVIKGGKIAKADLELISKRRARRAA